MNKYYVKLGTGVAAAALMIASVAPTVMADDTITVSHNGSNSTSNVTVENENVTSVSQSNNSTVMTFVDASSNTGKNTANDNTGGSTSVTTGDATTTVNTTVGGSSNDATLLPCTCNSSSTTIKVKHNGSNSKNTVNLENGNVVAVGQSNSSFVLTGIDADSNSGHNKTNKNTGTGGTSIKTGSSKTHITTTVSGSSNALH